MSILEGLDAAFNNILGAIYLDARLIRSAVAKETTGATTTRRVDDLDIKLQPNLVTKQMRENAGEQYTSQDARFLVLQVDCTGEKIDPPLSTGDRIIYGGHTWSLADISSDPANVYWDLRASPIG